jgi:ribonucleoside-diphosphate reductase alpha chain
MIAKSDYPDISWVQTKWGEFPSTYSDNACRIIGDKYFADGEITWFEGVNRVVSAITTKGVSAGYFSYQGDADSFEVELGRLLLHQHVSFNSPVWFNLGVVDNPQCSACFIQSVDDSIEGISELMTKEARIFKQGSGTGTNFSTIRPLGAKLSGGGSASGPLSFMKALDANAGAIKSGGRTRRSAKMALMDCDHRDVHEFIWSKAKEDRKARKAIAGGADPVEAYEDVWYQNGNHSVRLTDHFMGNAIEFKGDNHSIENKMLDDIAQAAWECGDPGVQFTDTINNDNPCPEDFTINASNPCSEYLFMDQSACNLASIKLSAYTVPRLSHIVPILIQAMDIIVSLSSYPTLKIAANSEKYRPLGLGFSNLGAYIMRSGHHYDSDNGRAVASDVSRAMLDFARQESERLAMLLGSNWDNDPFGALRNAQLTLIAPTGTISFAMDCESTGCEPLFAEEQIKNLSGGGQLVIVPECVSLADKEHIATAIGEHAITPKAHVDMMAAIQPYMSGAISKTVNMPADCTAGDIREMIVYAWERGIKCVAFYRDGSKGIQPLVEKKDIGMTDILNVVDQDDKDAQAEFMAQPARTFRSLQPGAFVEVDSLENITILAKPPEARRKLPATRSSQTHKFSVGGVGGYLTVGLYADNTPGELFVHVSKQGSTVAGLMDAWATSFSLNLQYGVPLHKLCSKFKGTNFEPAGFTGGEDIKSASSLIDYVCQWLMLMFEVTPFSDDMVEAVIGHGVFKEFVSGRTCSICGGLMAQTGTCQTCTVCGESSGGCG